MKKISVILLLIATATSIWAQENAIPKPESLVIFLVRHCEKVDQSRDPELSENGKERAKTLAQTLQDADIECVHSSDYIRTKNTAIPVASNFMLEIELYDPRNLSDLAEKLVNTGGRHLVVGHSNTTPDLVELLGGKAGSAIDEKSEYDRLYIVTISKDKSVSTVLLRYGAKYLK